MRKSAVIVGGLAASIVMTAGVIAALLIYYRPTVEYAFVNIVDNREGPLRHLPGWVLVALPLGGVAIVLVFYRFLRRNAPR